MKFSEISGILEIITDDDPSRVTDNKTTMVSVEL